MVSVLLIADKDSALQLSNSFMWVRETPERRKVVEKFWASGACSADQLTLFTAGPDVSPEQACADILDNIVLHHPELTSLEIVGARLSEHLLEALSAIGVERPAEWEVAETNHRMIRIGTLRSD